MSRDEWEFLRGWFAELRGVLRVMALQKLQLQDRIEELEAVVAKLERERSRWEVTRARLQAVIKALKAERSSLKAELKQSRKPTSGRRKLPGMLTNEEFQRKLRRAKRNSS